MDNPNNIYKFKKDLDELIEDISHHKIPNEIRFCVGDDTYILDDSEYPSGIEADFLPGCGCWVGARVHLKKEE